MATAYDTANIIIPKSAGYKSGSLYGWNPQVGSLVDFAVTRAGATATRVNEAGLIESVAANVPRIDWAEGGSCPSLLVEPQRTNNFLRSQEFDNASWVKISATVTTNSTTSPDGTVNADTFNINNSTGLDALTQSISVTSGTTYSMSVYVKAGTHTGQVILREGGNNANVYYNFGTSTTTSSGTWMNSAETVSVGNGWFRLKIVFTPTSTGSFSFQVATFNTGGTNNFFVWGAQFETGNYVTSYIPTTATTETRNADVIQKTGIASLLGQTAGSIAGEIKPFNTSSMRLTLTDSTAGGTIRISIASGDIILINPGRSNISAARFGVYDGTDYIKFASSYSPSSIAISVAGVDEETIGNASPTVTLTRVNFYGFVYAAPFFGRIRSLAIYNYALDSTERNSLSS